MNQDRDPIIRTPTTEPPPTPAGRWCGCGGWCGVVCGAVRGITIEPVLFLYVLAAVMTGAITTNLLLEKICVELSYSPEVCANLTSHPTQEATVQQHVTITLMYLSLITSLPSVVFALFLGSWSDKHGRKAPLVLPLCGSVLAALLYVVNAYYPSLPSTYILLAGVPTALTGGMTTLLMASFSYMADITKLRSRTTRIALLDLGFSIGSPVGILLSDVVFYYISYLGIYASAAVVYVLALVYALVRVEDTKGVCASRDGLCASRDVHTARKMCTDLFDTENVKRSFAAAFRWRPNLGRAKVLLLIAAMCLMVMEFGGIGMDYLFTKRMFGWSYTQYVQLCVTRLLIQLAVTSVVLPVLSYKLQVPDTVLVLVGCVSKILGTVVMGLAQVPWMLYLSAVITSIGVLPLVITRSLISKAVPGDELGRIFSVLASCEAVIPLASGPLYTAVYNTSILTFPGAVYFLSAGLYVVVAAVFIWVFTHSNTPALDTPDTSHIHADEIPDIEE